LRVHALGGEETYNLKMKYAELFIKHPELANHHKFYEMSPHEQQTDLWKRMRFLQLNYP
jgi:hypothetical protein